MSLQVTLPSLQKIDKTAIILIASVLFFALKILDIEDLEELPWNIVLLFSGAMSIGFCLWKTGAAQWMAVHWLAMFKEGSLVGFRTQRGSLCDDPDQFHHECRSHCHFCSCCPGHFRLFGRISSCRHVFLTHDGWDALHSFGRCCSECHRLCLQTVHERRVFQVRMYRKHNTDGGLCSGMLPDLALARDACDFEMMHS